jgi:hypothetical protein
MPELFQISDVQNPRTRTVQNCDRTCYSLLQKLFDSKNKDRSFVLFISTTKLRVAYLKYLLSINRI